MGGGIIRLPALCRDLGISGPHSEEEKKKKKHWGVGPGERVGGNINQPGTGVWLSGSALSARQNWKTF